MKRDGWIEPVIHILLAVSAVLALGGIITVIHFVWKFW